MDKMKDLKDLLRHEVLDLRSAEDQIIEAMPAMIEKAKNPQLAKALRQHLKVTQGQRKRIDQVINLLGEKGEKSGGFLSGLFGESNPKCKAMEGILTEANKIMAEDMNEEVMDAAIISAAQKVEHYEICGYGTAKAFARELGLSKVETLLNQTLNEEYDADNSLTKLAVGGGLNQKAEQADGDDSGSNRSRGSASNKSSAGNKSSTGGRGSSSNKASAGKKSASGSSSKAAAKSATVKGGAGKKASAGSSSNKSSSGKKAATGNGSKGASAKASAGRKTGTSNPGGNKKSAAKGASRGGGRGR